MIKMVESTYSTLKKMKRKNKFYHINALNKTNMKMMQKKNKLLNINLNSMIVQRKKNKKTNTRIDQYHRSLKKIQKQEWQGKFCNNRNVNKITSLLSQLKIDLSLSLLISSKNQSKINSLVYLKFPRILLVFLITLIYMKMMNQQSNLIVLQFL